jgi:hypothetical protein
MARNALTQPRRREVHKGRSPLIFSGPFPFVLLMLRKLFPLRAVEPNLFEGESAGMPKNIVCSCSLTEVTLNE